MNEYFVSFIFGTLQGITEFLPISSSGHLALASLWLNWPGGDLFFILVLHLGTLAAVLTVYKNELYKTVFSLKNLGLLSAALLPTAAAAFVLKHLVTASFKSSQAVGTGFVLTGVFLALLYFKKPAQALKPTTASAAWLGISFLKAFLIGAAQAAALFPGMSRSGWTIAAALFLNVPPSAAVFFSFLLALPSILGAVVWEGLSRPFYSVLSWGVLIPAFLSSWLAGYCCLKILIKLVKRRLLISLFALYLIPAGGLVICCSFL